MNLEKVKKLLEDAISKQYDVELRIEDSHSAELDSWITTKIDDVLITENYLNFSNSTYHLGFNYESCTPGSESDMHNKIYFKSKQITITVTIKH